MSSPTPHSASISEACPACGSTSTRNGTLRVAEFDIVKCGGCGLRFVPERQITNVNYDELYQEQGDYAHHVGEIAAMKAGKLPVFSRARRLALQHIEKTKPGSVLEIGCGVGNFLAWIQSFGIRGYGVDASANAIELARQHLSFPLHCGRFDESVFPGANFDAICTWEVIEHIHDVKSFTAGIFRRLNPGGCLMLSTPNYGSSWMLRDVPADPRSRPPVHVTFWDSPSLHRHLSDIGFGRIEIRPVSIPRNAAKRSGPVLGEIRSVLSAMLVPSQRQTLLAMAWKPKL